MSSPSQSDYTAAIVAMVKAGREAALQAATTAPALILERQSRAAAMAAFEEEFRVYIRQQFSALALPDGSFPPFIERIGSDMLTAACSALETEFDRLRGRLSLGGTA